jgi:hypothetical protein
MDRFLDTYDHAKLNQEDLNHLNISITQSEIKAAIESSKKKSSGPDGFSAEFYQMFKELIPTLLKMFHEIEREGTLPNSFYEAIITLIPEWSSEKENGYSPNKYMNIFSLLCACVLEPVALTCLPICNCPCLISYPLLVELESGFPCPPLSP